jgi:hypothetical protein
MVMGNVNVRNLNALASGGRELVTNTTLRSGRFSCVQVVADAVFTTLEGMTGTVTGHTFAAGLILYGPFTQVELASGKVVLYTEGDRA